MRELIILLDYKGHFGTKAGAVPYRSGMDKNLLAESFAERGIKVVYLAYPDIDFRTGSFKGRFVLYQGSEDRDLLYKSYIEDVILGLQLQGAVLIPSFHLLRAHHNKAFMEILRDLSGEPAILNVRSRLFGTLEDLRRGLDGLKEPLVIKPAAGSMSKGVRLGRDHREVLRHAKALSRSRHLLGEWWDRGRAFKRSGYIRESLHRRKIIVQDFIPGLDRDWKVLVFGDKTYALMRRNRSGDFRASGSGRLEFRDDLPAGLLDFARKVFDRFDVPHLSLDVGFDGKDFYLIEFQAVLFGTTTLEKAPFHFIRRDDGWHTVRETSILEREFAGSVAAYLDRLAPAE